LPPLLADLRASLGRDLVGAYLYGSAISGGFDPALSDLDLAVVTGRPTDGIAFDVFDGVVRRLQAREPDWADRLDIVFVGGDTLAGFRAGGRFLDISHDEPLRVIEDAADWLETWFLVRDADTALVGPSARSIIPEIKLDEFLGAVRKNVPSRVDMGLTNERPGAVAYVVLSLCRTLRSLATHAKCTKVEGAAWASDRFPEWSWLIRAALEVRSGDGARDFTPDEKAQIPRLLDSLAEQIRRAEPRGRPPYGSAR
jgi:hypothetical protein